eukprot:2626887-Rhodomonas_salina.1
MNPLEPVLSSDPTSLALSNILSSTIMPPEVRDETSLSLSLPRRCLPGIGRYTPEREDRSDRSDRSERGISCPLLPVEPGCVYHPLPTRVCRAIGIALIVLYWPVWEPVLCSTSRLRTSLAPCTIVLDLWRCTELWSSGTPELAQSSGTPELWEPSSPQAAPYGAYDRRSFITWFFQGPKLRIIRTARLPLSRTGIGS